MDRGSSHEKMGGLMKGCTKRTRSKALGYSFGRIIGSMKGSGTTENNMEWGGTMTKTEPRGKAYEAKARGMSGSERIITNDVF